MNGLAQAYMERYETALIPVAGALQALLAQYLREVPHIDRVVARAKEPARFVEKAFSRNKDGTPKYSDPLVQIQDQIGARIVVFYLSDVESVSVIVDRYLRPIEEKEVVPDDEWKFGYFGKHYILALPNDVFPPNVDRSLIPRFFELQIKSLFQHAWSEANHDLAYKPAKPLTDHQTRMFAFTAAQAWGADQIFQQLHDELNGESGGFKKGAS